MAHSRESDPFANVPIGARVSVFDRLHEQGLEGEALAEAYRRELRWAAIMPAADAAMAGIRETEAARFAGFVPVTNEETAVPSILIQQIDDLDQTPPFTD